MGICPIVCVSVHVRAYKHACACMCALLSVASFSVIPSVRWEEMPTGQLVSPFPALKGTLHSAVVKIADHGGGSPAFLTGVKGEEGIPKIPGQGHTDFFPLPWLSPGAFSGPRSCVCPRKLLWL